MKHPAIHNFYDILCGGIFYSAQCDEVFTDSEGTTIARCHYLNSGGPAGARYVNIPVDAEGKRLDN